MFSVHNRWTSTTMPHEFFRFFVCNIKKLIVWYISAKEDCHNLTKNSRKFQTVVTERCTRSGMFRQNLLKVTGKKLYFQKTFTTHELLHKWFLRLQLNFFSPIYLFTYLQNPVCVNLYSYLIHVIFMIRRVSFMWNILIQYTKKLYQILDFVA